MYAIQFNAVSRKWELYIHYSHDINLNSGKVNWKKFITFTFYFFMPQNTALYLWLGLGIVGSLLSIKCLAKQRLDMLCMGRKKHYANIVAMYANLSVIHHGQIIHKGANFLFLIWKIQTGNQLNCNNWVIFQRLQLRLLLPQKFTLNENDIIVPESTISDRLKKNYDSLETNY